MNLKSRGLSFALMTLLVCLWGLEYIVAKKALEDIEPLTLVFFKYGVAFVVLAPVKLAINRKIEMRRKHILPLFVCALFGDIIYYAAEYRALSYVSVAVLTILLSFVPLLSILIEWGFFGRRPSPLMLAGVFVCILGIALVIGVDLKQLRGGFLGYALGGVAILAWNLYNFFTEKLTDAFKILDLTLYQIACTLILLAPYIIANPPSFASMTPAALGGAAYLGVVSCALGFFIYVNALSVLGATPCALFSIFMPVTAAFFGRILLKETLGPLQIAGGGIVIASACVVLRQKNLLDANRAANEGKNRP
ncbi:MAG: DMT family transporter [Clostridiales Family XIII bacterium]|jgi:drug/metabolite transporter (DMT)-like permease|nr:DMT family transporter [Clostridiales Family XIII bacterium]